MRLIERDAELDEAGDLLSRAAAGTGGAVLISGAMGCGKSELLTALAHRARKQGLLVLDAACSAAEWRSPGGVLNQLLRRTALPAAPDTAGVPPLLEQVGALTPYADPEADDEQVLHPAVTEALRRLVAWVLGTAEHTPVLLCVDDVHLADDISVHWLRQLLRHLRSARVALVLTECPPSRPVHPQLRAELMRQPHYRRLSLGPLTPEGSALVLAEHLGDAAAALAADAYAASGGNPLLLRALAEDNLGAATSPRHACELRLSCGEAYRDMVMSLLHRGAAPLLRFARVLGVLHGDLDDGVVLPGALVDAEPAEVARAEQALLATGLLDGGRLRGPAARQAVLDSLSAAERGELHRRAAELLYREGAAVTRVAAHLLACTVVEQPWAGTVLREAAERHLAGNRATEAHACLDAALRLCGDEAERVSLKALLASTAWVLNPSMSAPHLGDLAVALRDGRLPDRHALMLARYLLWHGRFDEAVDAVQRIVEREELSDPGWAVEVRATRELLSASYPVLVEPQGRGRRRPRRLDPQSREGLRPEEDPRVRGAASLSHTLAFGPDDSVASVAEEAMRAMRLGKNTQEWLMCAVAALAFSDKTEAAASWCDHWLEESRSRHVPLWVAEFSSLRAGIALREGRPVRARLLAEAALAQVPAESWGVCIGGPLANLVQAATDTGDLEAAAAYLEYSFPEGMFSSRFGLYFLQARGYYYLAAGRPYAALDDFMACGDLMMRWGFDHPTLVPWRAEAARAHIMLNDRARAFALAREQMDLVDLRPTRARGITLRTLAAASPPAARVALLSEAVEVLQTCGDRLQLAGALADLGHAHIESGRPGRARAPRESALRLAREAGAEPLERELIADLAGSGPAWGRDDRAAFALLSGAERRVAVLASRGHTNKEFSQKLVIT
ncbi:MAG: AAA family ATPase, partial [Streptomyces sp.]|nr:AAA family ATPase [Streptomyces sp.]